MKDLIIGILAGVIIVALVIGCFVAVSWVTAILLNVILTYFEVKTVTTGVVMAGVAAAKLIRLMITYDI